MKITTGTQPTALKVLIYGPEGIGKSTLASQFPNPVFIDTEGSTKQLNISRLPEPESWSDIIDMVKYIANNAETEPYRTLVIDTMDWAEMFCQSEFLAKNQKKSIEDFGYGKGYVMLAEYFKPILDELNKVIDAGINVVLTAHAKMRKFEQPDEMGAYDRWEMKLSKQIAPLIKEWVDMMLFCNYYTMVITTEDKKKKARGGERKIYTQHHPCWDAKNRFGLEDELPMSYDSIAAIIPADPPRKMGELEKRAQTDGLEFIDVLNFAINKGWAQLGDTKLSAKVYAFLVENWEKAMPQIKKMRDTETIPFGGEEE